MDGFSKTWRLELFFKSSKELQEKCLPLLKEHSIQRLNITNKVSLFSSTLLAFRTHVQGSDNVARLCFCADKG